jgi:hypothetical protein
MKNVKSNWGSFATAKLQANSRKLLAIALVAVIGFSMASCGKSGSAAAKSAESGKTGDDTPRKSGGKSKPEDFGYVRTDGGIRIYYYTGSATDVVIPDTIERLPVVDVNFPYIFKGNDKLTSVVIPGTVKEIWDNAFNECTSLTTVTLSEGLTSIGEGAFRGCTSLKTVQIPESVTTIENNAFMECTSLTDVKLPQSLTTIGARTFSGCRNLVNLNVPTALTGFPNAPYNSYSYAFSDCGKLPLAVRDKLKSQGYKPEFEKEGGTTVW